jgi:hypothetical protein
MFIPLLFLIVIVIIDRFYSTDRTQTMTSLFDVQSGIPLHSCTSTCTYLFYLIAYRRDNRTTTIVLSITREYNETVQCIDVMLDLSRNR